MATLNELWKQNRDHLTDKSLSQIISFTGEGRLKDGNNTSKELREFFTEIPTQKLVEFVNHCLKEPTENGFALQDLVNQFGRRLGFVVDEGLYQGRRNEIGYDGIWTLQDDHSFVVEIKTTDHYRINLDTIVQYEEKLIEKGKLNKNKSSILIVVGRQDTGDLEAQIRGSRHAWGIRLISIEAIIKLLEIRELIDNNRVLKQINGILKPVEYTRLDSLIDLLFQTSQDSQLQTEEVTRKSLNNEGIKISERTSPMSYHKECVDIISKHLGVTFIKQSRGSYSSSNGKIGLTCSVSKAYPTKHSELFWYAFHPYQKDFLQEYKNGYVAFGCGSEDYVILIPFEKFLPLTANMNMTSQQGRIYHHVKIQKIENRFEIEQPLSTSRAKIDITPYWIVNVVPHEKDSKSIFSPKLEQKRK